MPLNLSTYFIYYFKKQITECQYQYQLQDRKTDVVTYYLYIYLCPALFLDRPAGGDASQLTSSLYFFLSPKTERLDVAGRGYFYTVLNLIYLY